MHMQVGIIALNLIGDPLPPPALGPPPFLSSSDGASFDTPYYNQAAAEVADLSLDMAVDPVTASRIKVCMHACMHVLALHAQ